METMTNKINLNMLDKSNWKSYPFEKIARSIGERVDPNKTDLEIYVGLEHLDPESIHIKRFGTPNDVKGQKLRCYPGDIIFGKRRAYQRKAALVDFDGICSAHAMVLRANPEIIDPKLFPFFLHSDSFMHRAIDISVGSLSPTINWKTLREQEFLLPPKDQQAQLAELLWAMDEVVENGINLKMKALIQFEVSKNKYVLEGFEKEIEYSNIIKKNKAKYWYETTIGKLVEEGFINKIQDGNHGEIHPKSSQYVQEGIPFIMANTLSSGTLDIKKAKKLPKEITDKLRIGFSLPGDVLLSHKGTVGEVAIVPNKIGSPYLMLTPQVTLYRTNLHKLNNIFLSYVFRAGYFKRQLLQLSSQSTRAYVGITSQKNLKIVLPNSLKTQTEIVQILSRIENGLKEIDLSIQKSKLLLNSLNNQIF